MMITSRKGTGLQNQQGEIHYTGLFPASTWLCTSFSGILPLREGASTEPKEEINGVHLPAVAKYPRKKRYIWREKSTKLIEKEYDDEGMEFSQIEVDLELWGFSPDFLNNLVEQSFTIHFTNNSEVKQNFTLDVSGNIMQINDVYTIPHGKTIDQMRIFFDDGHGGLYGYVDYNLTPYSREIVAGDKLSISMGQHQGDLPVGETTDDSYYSFQTETGGSKVAGIGLNYFGARYYDPELGIWVSTDKDMQFFSPFNYCGNNPINNVDYDGLVSYATATGVLPKVIGLDISDELLADITNRLTKERHQASVKKNQEISIQEAQTIALNVVYASGVFEAVGLIRNYFRIIELEAKEKAETITKDEQKELDKIRKKVQDKAEKLERKSNEEMASDDNIEQEYNEQTDIFREELKDLLKPKPKDDEKDKQEEKPDDDKGKSSENKQKKTKEKPKNDNKDQQTKK